MLSNVIPFNETYILYDPLTKFELWFLGRIDSLLPKAEHHSCGGRMGSFYCILKFYIWMYWENISTIFLYFTVSHLAKELAQLEASPYSPVKSST